MLKNDSEIIQIANMAEKLRLFGRYEESAERFAEAIKLISLKGASPKVESAIFSNFGLLMTKFNEHQKAIELQTHALKLDQKYGNKEDIGFSYHNLGSAFLSAGKTEEAILHLEKSLYFRRQIWDFSELATTIGMLLSAYLDADRETDARSLIDEWKDLEQMVGPDPAIRMFKAEMARLALRDGNEMEACRLVCEVIEILEAVRWEKEGIEKLDLFDARYNKYYLYAIELFLECKQAEAALALIDRTRFRSACDSLDRQLKCRSPMAIDALELPRLAEKELFLIEWIYPSHDFSFPIQNRMKSINFNRIKTSNISNPPKSIDLGTQWEKFFWDRIRQTQAVIDSYFLELDTTTKLRIVPHGTQWQTPFSALKHPNTGKPLLETHEVIVVPSLRYCNISDKMTRLEDGKDLVIGDPQNNLPDARNEAVKLAEFLDCEPILGRHASKDRIHSLLFENGPWRIIHFAGHGLYDNRGLQSIVLADGLIDARELIQKKTITLKTP